MPVAVILGFLLLAGPGSVPPTLGLVAPAQEADEAPSLADFEGSYHYLGGEKQKHEMEDAVELAIADMLGLIKGVARRRLRATQQPRKKLSLRVAGDRITVELPGNTTLEGRVGGKAFQFRGGDGIWRRTTVRRKGRSIVITIVGTKDKTIFTFRLGKQGWLTMKTRIEHVRMPAPLQFRYTYKR